MNIFRTFAITGVLVGLLSAQAQAEPALREYGVSLGGSAGRSWSGGGSSSDSVYLGSSLLFLNEHFHFGPQLNVSRTYGGDYQNTDFDVGALGKWTYENLQTASHTPFILVGANRGQGKSSYGSYDSNSVLATVGYETFLTSSVSLAQGLSWRKSWSEFEDTHSVFASVSAYLDLSIYL